MSDTAPSPARNFAGRVIAWQKVSGRHDLPWQRAPTPYGVWVSEIMLQQTQVSAVVGYYERFMARFADVNALAGAELDAVLHLWSGLGYYSRARNLHAAARQIVAAHGGCFPDSMDALQALPGIGRTTAAAIASLAFGQPQAILDGNVKRVLCRHRGVAGYPGAGATLRRLWALAEAQMPERDAARYTQGMMDLGATVCTRSRPHCLLCPVNVDCVARRDGSVDSIPAPRPRRVRPLRHTRFLIVRDPAARVLLEQRPPTGIWGGLWGFPELTPADDPESWCLRVLGQAPEHSQMLSAIRHGFTHFELEISPLLATLKTPPSPAADGDARLWYDPGAPSAIGLAAPVAKLLRGL